MQLIATKMTCVDKAQTIFSHSKKPIALLTSAGTPDFLKNAYVYYPILGLEGRLLGLFPYSYGSAEVGDGGLHKATGDGY